MQKPELPANEAERMKSQKYTQIANQGYIFHSVSFECQGSCGEETHAFIKQGKKLIQQSQDTRSPAFLKQRLSIAIQIGNAASVIGTLPQTEALDEIFNL